MKKKMWVIGILALFVSLIFDRAIVKYFENNRILELNELIGTLSTFTNGFFSFLIVGAIIFFYKRKLILRFLTGFLATGIVAYLLKVAIRRLRPFEALDVVNLIDVTSKFSFPSGHAIFAFFCLGFIWKDFKKFRWIWLIAAILIAFFRLYAGVHYLSDLIASLIFGVFIGNLFRKKNIFKGLSIFK